MKKLTKWVDRPVTESTQPNDPTWEEKLKQKIAILNNKLRSAVKQFNENK